MPNAQRDLIITQLLKYLHVMAEDLWTAVTDSLVICPTADILMIVADTQTIETETETETRPRRETETETSATTQKLTNLGTRGPKHTESVEARGIPTTTMAVPMHVAHVTVHMTNMIYVTINGIETHALVWTDRQTCGVAPFLNPTGEEGVAGAAINDSVVTDTTTGRMKCHVTFILVSSPSMTEHLAAVTDVLTDTTRDLTDGQKRLGGEAETCRHPLAAAGRRMAKDADQCHRPPQKDDGLPVLPPLFLERSPSLVQGSAVGRPLSWAPIRRKS